MAATKASPATDEPVKRTATKTPAKKPAAKAANGSAPAKRVAKAAPRAATAEAGDSDPIDAGDTAPAKPRVAKKAPAARGRGKKDATAADGDAEVGTDEDVDTELDGEPDIDVVVDDELELDDLEVVVDDADEDGDEAATTKAPAAAGEASDEEDISEPSEKDKASGDFVWDEEESEALRQARKDAELTASADSVRAYLKQIGKVALLNAEEEVELAKRIEAGLYATQLMVEKTDKGEKLPVQQRRDMQWICRDGDRAKNHLLEAMPRPV